VKHFIVGLCVVAAVCFPLLLLAQGGGSYVGSSSSRGGGVNGGAEFRGPSVLQTDAALNFITVEGTVETRIKPESIRVVMAVIAEADDAAGCQQKIAASITAVKKEWAAQGIEADNIVEDFISVLPVYQWRREQRDGQQMMIQQPKGFRMQSNLHIAVKTEKEAMAAINASFKHGVTDIVTFDYWSPHLDKQKAAARTAALAEAKKKAELLLSVFEHRPAPVNIQDSTRVIFPTSQYKTYQNQVTEEYTRWSSNTPVIRAHRPKMTFIQGVQVAADSRPAKMLMEPEIAVVSTVRIYYQAPAAHSRTVNITHGR